MSQKGIEEPKEPNRGPGNLESHQGYSEENGIKVVDRVGKVENVGVEFIPESERHSSIINIFWILFGGSMTFGVILVGWIPVSLGLGWWDTVSAIVVGSVIGSTLLAPMTLFGPRTGTNSPVSSGAHFGAVGRLIGSALGVAACIVFAALSVWAAGDVLSGSAARLLGSEDGAGLGLQTGAYAIVAAVMIIIAILGHANMVAMCKLMTPTAGGLMIIGIFAYLPNFDASYSGGDYVLGSYWATWFAGMIACAATTNSYGPYAGDWTRHLSRKKYKDWQLLAVTWCGGFFGMGGAYLFGAYTAVTFTDPTVNYAVGLVDNSPFWYIFPLLYIGLVAGTAQAVINIYSMGLDFSAIVPKLSRVQSTVILGLVSTALVFIGAIYQEIPSLIASFLAILVILGAPWVVINVIGFINRRGHYFPYDLQVFNRGEIGGRYWFSNGLNYQGSFSWFAGAATGALFINTGWYVGPLADVVGGADIGLGVSIGVAALLYITMLNISPEPDYVFGPDGSVFGSKKADDTYVPIQKEG